MDINTIKAAIQAWGAIHHNGSAMVQMFQQGNSFLYSLPNYAAGSPRVHVYPGIYQNNLLFFVIPSNYDSAQYAATINNYVTVCDARWFTSGTHDRITFAEAHDRIERWHNHYHNWVPARANTVNGVFQAFSIPIQDFETTDVGMVLGLKLQLGETMDQKADMIVVNQMPNRKIYFDDFVRSVPPYGATENPSDFYLML